MKAARLALPVLVAAALGTLPAQAATFSNVVVFGDSLSDAGYYRPFLAGLGLPANVVAGMGRFTTNPGPVWSELVSQYYGVAAGPSNASGSIFAQGGARVADASPLTPPGQAQRSVQTQIGEYLARGGSVADPNALHAVWAGANDLFVNLGAFQAGAISQAQLQTNVLGAAAAEIAQVARLRAAGARYIMVFALPDVGATPQFAAAGAATAGAVTALSAGYNTTLFTGLAQNGIRAIPVDTFSLLAEIRANPAPYGFTNITGIACGPFPPITTSGSSQFCLTGTNLVAPGAENSYLFADGVHPTTGAHRIVANFVTSLLEGPTTLSTLAEVPLRTRAGHVAVLDSGLQSGQRAETGKLTAFAGASNGDYDLDGGGASLGSTNNAVAIGVTMRATEAVTIGAAFGKSKGEATFGSGGGFRTVEEAMSLFAGVKMGGFHASGTATIADVDFNDVRRHVQLGNVLRVAESRPQGTNASFFLNGGYDFTFGKFSVGPVAAWTSQNVEINSFDEAGAGSANLRIGQQKRRSDVGSFGVRASLDLGTVVPYAKFTADKERKNDERFVTATPLTLVASGNAYDLPAFQSDASFNTVALGVRGVFGGWLGYGLQYTKVSGRSGVKEDLFSGSLSVKF
jgi:outer membrane lipase/esterase